MGGGSASTDSPSIGDVRDLDTNLVEVVSDQWKKLFPSKTYLTQEELCEIMQQEEVQKATHNPALKNPSAALYVFQALDTNHDNQISVGELIFGLSILSNGTYQEKAQLLFAAFDEDGNGFLTREELTHCLHTTVEIASRIIKENRVTSALQKGYNPALAEASATYEAQKALTIEQERIPATVDYLFATCDTNNDNQISRQEWIAQCCKDPILQKLINTATRNLQPRVGNHSITESLEMPL